MVISPAPGSAWLSRSTKTQSQKRRRAHATRWGPVVVARGAVEAKDGEALSGFNGI